MGFRGSGSFSLGFRLGFWPSRRILESVVVVVVVVPIFTIFAESICMK